MARQWGHEIFRFTRNGNDYEIYCHGENTRSGFKHVGSLFRNNNHVFDHKVCYINHTWESYTYQTLLHEIIHDLFSDEIRDYSKSKHGRKVVVGPSADECEAILKSADHNPITLP